MTHKQLADFYTERTGKVWRWQLMDKRRIMELLLKILPSCSGEKEKEIEQIIVNLSHESQKK